MKRKYIAVVVDNFSIQESIKSEERAFRDNVQKQYILNPQEIPKQQLKMMSNIKNKANMANFLMEDWIVKCEETHAGL